jgi:hypothetical protein
MLLSVASALPNVTVADINGCSSAAMAPADRLIGRQGMRDDQLVMLWRAPRSRSSPDQDGPVGERRWSSGS